MEIHVVRETPIPQPLPAVQSVTLVLTEQEFRDLRVVAANNLDEYGLRPSGIPRISTDRYPLLKAICDVAL